MKGSMITRKYLSAFFALFTFYTQRVGSLVKKIIEKEYHKKRAVHV